MFTIFDDLPTEFEFNGISGKLTLAFDNVLKVFHMFKDPELMTKVKVIVSLQLITDLNSEYLKSLSNEDLTALFEYIFNTFVTNKKPMLIPKSMKARQNKKLFDYEKDSDYIYASFLQDYHMDLFEQQGKLHWWAFNALIDGLTDKTKFKSVIEIRQSNPHAKGLSKEERRNIRDMQQVYSLDIDEDEIAIQDMDLLEQEAYFREKYKKERSEN